MCEFFTRAIYEPMRIHTVPLRSKDGFPLVKDKEGSLNHWQGYFSELLSRDSRVTPDTIYGIPQTPNRTEFNKLPFLEEVHKAIVQMKNKASGSDGIPSKIYKHGGEILTLHVYHLFLKIWNTEEICQDLKDVMVVTIFKEGDRADCGNFRGISLLTVAGKILTKVLLNRLQPLSESILPETQCSFRPTRGTADMIFAACQVQEKGRDQRRDLCFAIIDLTKAFDSVNSNTLWGCLARLGCPPKFVSVTRQLHENMKGCVLHDVTNRNPLTLTLV